MIIRILLSLALTLALTGLSGQPYTTGEYTVPSLSKQEVRSIIRDRSRLRKKVEELKLTNTRLNNYINSLKGQMSTLNAKGEKTAADRLELVRLNAKYMNLITQLESNVTTLKLLLATAEKKVEALEGVLAELREEIEVHKNTLAALQEKLDHFKEKATALEIELLYREAELTFLERSFSVASIDVFRIQRGKAVSVGRNKYKRGLRRKDAIEIHLWAYTFDETFIEAKRGKGVLTFYLPDGRTKKVRTMFSPAKNINKQVERQADVAGGVSPGYGMLYRMQCSIELSKHLDKDDLKKKGKFTTIPYEVMLPNEERFFGRLNVRR